MNFPSYIVHFLIIISNASLLDFRLKFSEANKKYIQLDFIFSWHIQGISRCVPLYNISLRLKSRVSWSEYRAGWRIERRSDARFDREEIARLDKISLSLSFSRDGSSQPYWHLHPRMKTKWRWAKEWTSGRGERAPFPYPFTKCRDRATKSIAYRFPRTQRLPNRSETILMAG